MPYVSPINLLSSYKLPVELKLDRDTLRIARQALLAEIDLSPQQTVTVGNKVMTRNDVLQLFDTIQGDEQLKYHEAIHADPPLLDFFANGKIPARPIAQNQLYNDPGFVSFITPFYPEMFARAFQDLVNKPSFERLNGLFSLPETWNTGTAKRETEVLVKQYLRQIYSKLEQFVEPNKGKTGVIVRKAPVEQFYNHHFLDALNRLPESYTDFRTSFGVLLLELAYIFWNNKNRSESNLIARRAENLKGSYDLEYQVQHYWSQCNQKLESSSSGGLSAWNIVFVVILLIRIIIAIGNCNSSSSRNYAYDNASFKVKDMRDRWSNNDYSSAVEAPPEIVVEEAAPSAKSKKPDRNAKNSVAAQQIPERPVFFDLKKDRLDNLLFKMDSLGKSLNHFRPSTPYDRLYRDFKSDTTIRKK